MPRIDRKIRKYIDDRLASASSGQVQTDATHRFVTDAQIAAWTAGSKVRAVVIPVANISGTTYQAHNLNATDIWTRVKGSNGQIDLNIIAVADPANANQNTALNYVKVTVPAGESFTGEIEVVTVVN